MCKINMGNVGCDAYIAPLTNYIHDGQMQASVPTYEIDQ